MRRKTLRTALVGVLCFTMTVDSATAFQLFGGGWRTCGGGRLSSGGWRTTTWVSTSYSGRGNAYGCGNCGGCGGCGCEMPVVVYDSCYGCGGIVDNGYMSGTIVNEQPAPAPVYDGSSTRPMSQSPAQPPAVPPTPAMETLPATVNRIEQETFAPQTPAADSTMPATSQPSISDMDTPSRVTRPGERQPFDELFDSTSPSATTPSALTPPPAASAPATSSASPMPAATPPATSASSPANDLFGPAAPAAATPPAETPAATTPSTPAGGLDDIFGTSPSASTPAGSTSTPPAATNDSAPATSPPPSASDLFGAPTTPSTAPSTPPAEQPAASPAASDLFGPASTPATTPAAAPSDNDLFGPPTTPASTPAEQPSTPPADDDLFRSAQVLREDGGLASDANREWVDNTGRYATTARLVAFLDGHVRLLKENGRTTTVPLARLSQNDLNFVNRQASAQQDSRALELARANVVVPLASN